MPSATEKPSAKEGLLIVAEEANNWAMYYAGLNDPHIGLFGPSFSRRAMQIEILSNVSDYFKKQPSSFTTEVAKLCQGIRKDVTKTWDSKGLGSLEKELKDVVMFTFYIRNELPLKINKLPKEQQPLAWDGITRNIIRPVMEQARDERRLLEAEELSQISKNINGLLEELANTYSS
jgi:hypothetical protein